MNEWMTDWLIDWLIDWSIDWMTQKIASRTTKKQNQQHENIESFVYTKYVQLYSNPSDIGSDEVLANANDTSCQKPVYNSPWLSHTDHVKLIQLVAHRSPHKINSPHHI